MGGGSNRHATASRAQQSRPSKSPGCRREESCIQSHNALPSREGTSEVLGLRRLLPMCRLGVHLCTEIETGRRQPKRGNRAG